MEKHSVAKRANRTFSERGENGKKCESLRSNKCPALGDGQLISGSRLKAIFNVVF
jgi:hypothetical protein